MSTRRAHDPRPIAIAIAFAGLLSLAIAMGIGRFAFTPLLPMMLHDGVSAVNRPVRFGSK